MSYRNDNEAAVARARAAIERFDRAADEIDSLRLAAGREPAARQVITLDEEANAATLTLLAERCERKALETERMLASERRASTPPRSPESEVEGTRTDARSMLGEALARHAEMKTRLRRIAPLIVTARACLGRVHIDAVSILAPRPASRGHEDPVVARKLADEMNEQCARAERAIAELGLASATGSAMDRRAESTHWQSMIRALLEQRYSAPSETSAALSDLLAALQAYDAALAPLLGLDLLAAGSRSVIAPWPDLQRAESPRDIEQCAKALREAASELERNAKTLAALPKRPVAEASITRGEPTSPLFTFRLPKEGTRRVGSIIGTSCVGAAFMFGQPALFAVGVVSAAILHGIAWLSDGE